MERQQSRAGCCFHGYRITVKCDRLITDSVRKCEFFFKVNQKCKKFFIGESVVKIVVRRIKTRCSATGFYDLELFPLAKLKVNLNNFV